MSNRLHHLFTVLIFLQKWKHFIEVSSEKKTYWKKSQVCNILHKQVQFCDKQRAEVNWTDRMTGASKLELPGVQMKTLSCHLEERTDSFADFQGL